MTAAPEPTRAEIEAMAERLDKRTVHSLPMNWQKGLKCPECGSSADRPKCFHDMGPTCPRHDPNNYDSSPYTTLPDADCVESAAMLRALASQALPSRDDLARAACGSGILCDDPIDGREAGSCSRCGGVADRIRALPASPAAPSQGEVADLKRQLADRDASAKLGLDMLDKYRADLAERDAELERTRQRSASWAGEFGSQCSRAEAAKAKLAEAVKVIAPFAKHASGYESFDGQHDYLDSDEVKLGPFKVTVGDLRRARSLLARINGA